MKLVRLIKMCLTETCSRGRVGNILSDMFPIRMFCNNEIIYRHRFKDFFL